MQLLDQFPCDAAVVGVLQQDALPARPVSGPAVTAVLEVELYRVQHARIQVPRDCEPHLVLQYETMGIRFDIRMPFRLNILVLIFHCFFSKLYS